MRITLAVALLALAHSALAAQEPGGRIRLATSAGNPQVGRLVALTADSVRIADSAGAEQGFARNDLRRLELSMGRKSSVGRGVGRGALIGTALGLMLGVLASSEDGSIANPCNGAACVAVGAAGGAMWGVAIGAAVGALSKHEAWQPLGRVNVRPQLHPATRSAGLSVGF